MASIPTSASISGTDNTEGEVSIARLYVLRATYLFIVVGLGTMIVPSLIDPAPTARGVIPSLLGGIALLAIVGLKYPLQMLPLLLFELAWKTIWLLAFGIPQWSSAQVLPTYAEDFQNILFGVILMPIVIPWGYVYRHYFRQRATRWR